MADDSKRMDFLVKRASRFIRKLARPSRDETIAHLNKLSDSLIITSKYEPLPVLKKLLPYLASSCPFVIFSEHVEPLALCYDWLKQEKLAVALKLTDTWRREYQMLAGRTHPEMTMSAHGGYILTGIKVEQGLIKVEKKGKLVGLGMNAQRHGNRATVAKAIREKSATEQAADAGASAKKRKTDVVGGGEEAS
ncbi:hypothetical protein TeGR_g10725 [Tetraparma gracilis]|uniref:tRNA (adenine(58)-N(1))-methyltransferase non-catalytic subunit TRM6 n=1 Tax=Tetraparma gracilis TaxID=2962635 RepID=A0ABQ6M5H6_9STRA|nr:hypothetical protein TeGR_g10725 [Tetraparma gracilis]